MHLFNKQDCTKHFLHISIGLISHYHSLLMSMKVITYGLKQIFNLTGKI